MARAAEAPLALALALAPERRGREAKKSEMKSILKWVFGKLTARSFCPLLPCYCSMDGEDEADHLGRSSRGGDLPLLDAAPAGVPSAEGKGGEQERYRESMSEMYVRHNLRVHCSPVSPSLPSNAHTSYVPHALDVFGPRSRFAHSTALPLRSLSPPGPFPRRFIEGSSDGENEALRFVLAAKFVTDALEGRAIHTKYGRQELINPSVKERVLSSKM